MPKDLIKQHKITVREDRGYGPQTNAGEVLTALKDYKMTDTFCTLAVTNNDLYPKEEWNFVFGLANMDSRCGVFSFRRQMDEIDDDLPADEMRRKFLELSVGTMVHEIAHMFGLKHCIYYECTMNGSNGLFETNRRPNAGMCPMCLYKLKANIKFDTRERYEKLLEASKACGFTDKAEKIQEILDIKPVAA